jgi:hypothetical protein
MERRVV